MCQRSRPINMILTPSRILIANHSARGGSLLDQSSCMIGIRGRTRARSFEVLAILGAKPASSPCPMVSRILRSVYKGGTATGAGRLGPSSPGTEICTHYSARKTAGCFIYLFFNVSPTTFSYFLFPSRLFCFLNTTVVKMASSANSNPVVRIPI